MTNKELIEYLSTMDSSLGVFIIRQDGSAKKVTQVNVGISSIREGNTIREAFAGKDKIGIGIAL